MIVAAPSFPVRMAQTWFADRGPIENLVAPIDDLLHAKEEWAVSVAEIPSESRIAGSKIAPSPRRNAVVIFKCNKEDLQSQIDTLRDLPGASLTSRAFEAMEMAGLSQSKWRIERQQSTSKKAGAAFQKSMTSFAQFLESFSGIVEIVKGADQQYGGLAYGTLSLMLTVFVRKTQREQALDEGFEELGLACPRLHLLQNLRHEGIVGDHGIFTRLEDLIVSALCLVVVYAKEATKYYSSKFQRVKEVFTPEQVKEKTLVAIRKTLNEIRNECDLLMLMKLTCLQEKIDKMSISVEATHKQSIISGHQISRARVSSDTSHLAELRQILSVKVPSIHTDLEKYKSLLGNAFFAGYDLRSKHFHPKQISMELLRSDGEFERWWNSSASCLLLAGGTNFDDSSSGSLNWLSCGAMLVIEEIRRQNRKVAFFLAQTSLNVRRRRCTNRDIIATLIYQIAEMHDDLLRGKLDRLKAAVESPAWNVSCGDDFLSEMQDLLLELFLAFPPEEEIFIVIDRLDQCAWEGSEDDDQNQEMRHAIEALLHVAAEAKCRLKVLLTVNAASSQKLSKVRSVLDKKERKALLLKPEWCQETDEGRSDI